MWFWDAYYHQSNSDHTWDKDDAHSTTVVAESRYVLWTQLQSKRKDNFHIFDFQLDYCASTKNLRKIRSKKNYKFIQVSASNKNNIDNLSALTLIFGSA